GCTGSPWHPCCRRRAVATPAESRLSPPSASSPSLTAGSLAELCCVCPRIRSGVAVMPALASLGRASGLYAPSSLVALVASLPALLSPDGAARGRLLGLLGLLEDF